MKKIKLFVLAKGFAMLTTKEAAELLDITPRRVQELIKNGALEARKASGVWLIDKDSVNARLRSVTKTGGRPRRGHGKSEITFTLMNRTHEVAQLVYSTSRKDFTHIGADIDYIHAPIGVLGPNSPVSLDSFRIWWRGRGIPLARIGLASLLAEAAVDVPDELIQRNLGLSLSDSIGLDPKIPVSRGRILTSSIMLLTTSLCPSHPSPQRAKQPPQSPITPRTATFRSIGHARAGVEFCIRQERT